MNIVCTISRDNVNANPAAFVAKATFPERFYVFPGLDHSAYFSDEKIATPSLAEQVDRLIALGDDGIKMIETKRQPANCLTSPLTASILKISSLTWKRQAFQCYGMSLTPKNL